MKKPYHFSVLSVKRCCVCNARVKANLAERKPDDVDLYCYSCFRKKEANRNHTINSFPRQKRVSAGMPVKFVAVA